MEGMDRAPLEGVERVFDEAAFVQRIGVDRNLNIEPVCNRQAIIDRGWCRTPVLMQLQTTGTGADHFFQCTGQ
ncbi:hypothetical protein D3C80_1887440 [compost metagenome]